MQYFLLAVETKMASKKQSPISEPQNKNNPYPFYARVRSESPVYPAVLPNGVNVFLVTHYADVLAGLKDERLVKNIHNARPKGLLASLGIDLNFNSTNMLRNDPPEHTRLRALAHAAFTPRIVNQMRSHIQDIADRLLDAVQPQGRMDLINDFAFPLPISVITEMLGVPSEDNQKFRVWSTALINSGALSSESPYLVPELVLSIEYFTRLIKERRKNPQDDLISQLIRAEQNGDHFSENEVIGTSILLLVAGHETTVNLIGNGMLALLQQREQFEKLKGDPSLIKPAVEEILRFVNPVQMVNRYASVDLEIGGVKIPKGSHLMLVVAAANHDPGFVGAPEQLNLDASDARHMAFGQGIHYCLGAPLARLEGEIAFTTLIRRLPELRLADPEARLEWRPAFELRGLSSLPVVF
jgi:cytochrome P450